MSVFSKRGLADGLNDHPNNRRRDSGLCQHSGSVVYEARTRAKLREQQRRDNRINLITNLWAPDGGMTVEERCGFPSKRKIDFFNSKLREMGETWTYPFERI